MTIKIDKNIPIPTGASNRKYPFGDMKVGDSFLAKRVLRKTFLDTLRKWKKRNKSKFEFYIAPEKGAYRLWRTK